jgi:membrane fusion protein, multidrug efflux system
MGMTRPLYFRLLPIAVGALALAVFGGEAVLAQGADSGSAKSQSPASGGVPVQVAKATLQDVPVTMSNIGTVQAYQSVLVRARVDGTLEKVLFREGQEVNPGDLLAEIDPRPYAAALAQALAKRAADQAMLVGAQKDLSRYSNLAKDQFGSVQTVDQQTAMVGQDQANLAADAAAIATAQLNLQFCDITSPIQGRVGLRQVDPGNLIHATDTNGIVTITQIRPISVIFTLPQDALPVVQDAMRTGTLPVVAYTADNKTELGTGALETIDNQIDQTTGTMKLKANFPNQDERLWPGQFINVQLQLKVLKNAVTVPSGAIQRGPDGLYVYVVHPDKTVAMQAVRVQQDNGRIAVVTEGVSDGTEVVTNGQSRLQTGSRITALPTTGS